VCACALQTSQKHAPIVASPTENPKSEMKKLFFSLIQKTRYICRGFERLYSSIGWWVTALRAWTNPKLGQDEKGYLTDSQITCHIKHSWKKYKGWFLLTSLLTKWVTKVPSYSCQWKVYP